MSLLAVTIGLSMLGSSDDYTKEVEAWRKQVETNLKADQSWLTLSGLYWLPEGVSSFKFVDHKLVLPAKDGEAPIGSFIRTGNTVSIKMSGDNTVTIHSKRVSESTLGLDADPIIYESTTMLVIQRGKRIGVRTWDKNNENRVHFRGQKWFPIDSKYLVNAKYVAYDKPKEMMITNVIGDTAPVSNPGYVEFTLHGKPCRLEAQAAGDGFFFNFRDANSGKTTYAAGRFLDTPGAVNGIVTIDFNKAYNPPCAFTDFATCPLPPRENVLTEPVNAGEMAYPHHRKS